MAPDDHTEPHRESPSSQGAAQQLSADQLNTLEFLGQGSGRDTRNPYEPLPRWGNPLRALGAGLAACALLGTLVYGGLNDRVDGLDVHVGRESPTGSGEVSSSGPDVSKGSEALLVPRHRCLQTKRQTAEPRDSRDSRDSRDADRRGGSGISSRSSGPRSSDGSGSLREGVTGDDRRLGDTRAELMARGGSDEPAALPLFDVQRLDSLPAARGFPLGIDSPAPEPLAPEPRPSAPRVG